MSCVFQGSYTWAHIFKKTLDLRRKLRPKWGGGPIFCSGRALFCEGMVHASRDGKVKKYAIR